MRDDVILYRNKGGNLVALNNIEIVGIDDHVVTFTHKTMIGPKAIPLDAVVSINGEKRA